MRVGTPFSVRHFGISALLCVSILLSPRIVAASQPDESITEDLLLLRSGAVGTDPGRPFPGSGAAGRGGGEAQFRGGEAEFRDGQAEFRGGEPVFRGWKETGTEQAVQGPDTIVNLSSEGVRSMTSLAMPSVPSANLTPSLPAVPGIPGVPGVPGLAGLGLPGMGLGAAALLAGVPNMVPGMPSIPGTDLLSTLGIMGALSMLNSLPQLISTLPQQMWGMVTGMASMLTQLPQVLMNLPQTLMNLPQTLGQAFLSLFALGQSAGNLSGINPNLASPQGQLANSQFPPSTTPVSAAQGGVASSQPISQGTQTPSAPQAQVPGTTIPAGQGNNYDTSNWPSYMKTAYSYLGTSETVTNGDNGGPIDTFNASNNQKNVKWCANFLNYVLEQNGIQGTTGPSRAMALSFKNWGTDAKGPVTGSIGVISYGGGAGHVGIVVGVTPTGRVLMLGGNQGDSVKISSYPRNSFVAFRLPPGGAGAGTQLINGGGVPTGGYESTR